MLLLAIAAFGFGLIAAAIFTAAPFAIGNVVAAVAVVAFALASRWSPWRAVEGVVLTLVCLQAAFLVGAVRRAAKSRRRAPPDGQAEPLPLPGDASTMDRTR